MLLNVSKNVFANQQVKRGHIWIYKNVYKNM